MFHSLTSPRQEYRYNFAVWYVNLFFVVFSRFQDYSAVLHVTLPGFRSLAGLELRVHLVLDVQ